MTSKPADHTEQNLLAALHRVETGIQAMQRARFAVQCLTDARRHAIAQLVSARELLLVAQADTSVLSPVAHAEVSKRVTEATLQIERIQRAVE